MNRSFCEECFNKQRLIDELQEENARLKQALNRRQRQAQQGFFGSSTPSSKLSVKPNVPPAAEKKKRGARTGHKGRGRKAFNADEADQVVDVKSNVEELCPRCGEQLRNKGVKERMVVEIPPVKVQRILYRLPVKYCACCNHTFTPSAPSVLPKSLYGNQLIATAAAMHYLHGVPIGRVCAQLGLEPGALTQTFHRLASQFVAIPERLIAQYRQSPVKHADETGWRTEGKNGYAWLFATNILSIFQFNKTRSGQVPQAVFGTEPLPGVLVVDRYAGYNKSPCLIQYCYSHLLREVEDLEKTFPDSYEIKCFAATLAPLLASAMKLRVEPSSDAQFYLQACEIKDQIITTVQCCANHPGIKRVQDIFRNNESRLYHWADDRRVPAENNLAERDLRPTVIARKTSFGSQSETGANTRGTLMTVFHTLKKRGLDVALHIKQVLDRIANNPQQDVYTLLFPEDHP
jgi:transposase